MMTFESDKFPISHVRVLPYGTPDLLDEWFDSELDEAYGEWAELTYDPDGPYFE